MDRKHERDRISDVDIPRDTDESEREARRSDETPNPPHTTTGKVTSPKLSSCSARKTEMIAGSGIELR